MTHRLILWDWKEQPPWAKVNDAVRELSGEGSHAGPVNPRLAPDTRSDEYGLVVADEELTDERAQAIFDEYDAEWWDGLTRPTT